MGTRHGLVIAAAVVGAALGSNAFGTSTQTFFGFDPDGSGPLGTIQNVTEFGYATDNSLAVGANTAIVNFVRGVGPVTFNTYAQSRVANITDVHNNNVTPAYIPARTAELTFVAGFQEAVTFVNPIPPGVPGNFAEFKATGATGGGVPNFFELYYDSKANANPLKGTGYNDGTLILKGLIDADAVASTLFSVTGGGLGTPLDIHPPINDYPALSSVTGIGTSQLHGTVTWANPDFFKDMPLSMTYNTFDNLNFDAVDPAAAFQFTPGGSINGQVGDPNGPTLAGAGIGIPSLGPVDGGIPGLSAGPDVQFMPRGTNTLTVAVPEPITATMGLLSLGALGLVVSRRRNA